MSRLDDLLDSSITRTLLNRRGSVEQGLAWAFRTKEGLSPYADLYNRASLTYLRQSGLAGALALRILANERTQRAVRIDRQVYFWHAFDGLLNKRSIYTTYAGPSANTIGLCPLLGMSGHFVSVAAIALEAITPGKNEVLGPGENFYAQAYHKIARLKGMLLTLVTGPCDISELFEFHLKPALVDVFPPRVVSELTNLLYRDGEQEFLFLLTYLLAARRLYVVDPLLSLSHRSFDRPSLVLFTDQVMYEPSRVFNNPVWDFDIREGAYLRAGGPGNLNTAFPFTRQPHSMHTGEVKLRDPRDPDSPNEATSRPNPDGLDSGTVRGLVRRWLVLGNDDRSVGYQKILRLQVDVAHLGALVLETLGHDYNQIARTASWQVYYGNARPANVLLGPPKSWNAGSFEPWYLAR